MRGLVLISANPGIPFMRMRPLFLLISAIMIVGSLALIIFRGFNFGIDFVGGIMVEVRTPEPANIAALRDTLSGLALGEVTIQEFGSPNEVLIRVGKQPGGEKEQQEAIGKVREALGGGIEYRRIEVVGPQVSAELLRDGIYAVTAALASIFIYVWFRFEWQFAVNGILALLHDVITTLGLFSLLGLEFNLTSVAALMTIAGYSINDTVVIFDRVRENLRKYKTMPIPALVDLSNNETLSRTVTTASTAFLAVLALYIFGGEVLRGFSLAMLWGIVTGTYSSICFATPILASMNLRSTKTGGALPDAGAGTP